MDLSEIRINKYKKAIAEAEIREQEHINDEENDFDYPTLSHDMVTENDQVIVGDIAIKTGNVWNAAKIACVLYALYEDSITYEEAMNKIDKIRPRLF